MSGNLPGGVLIVLAVGEHDLVLSLDNTGQADAIWAPTSACDDRPGGDGASCGGHCVCDGGGVLVEWIIAPRVPDLEILSTSD